MGKTRLLEYAGASAAEQGMRFLSGSCFDLGTSSLPYAPYADLIRDLIAEEGLPAIRQMAGRDAQDLGRLVPAMADAQAEADETPAPAASIRGDLGRCCARRLVGGRCWSASRILH